MCDTDHLLSNQTEQSGLNRRQILGAIGAIGAGAAAGTIVDPALAAATGATLDDKAQPATNAGYEPPPGLAKDSSTKNTALSWLDNNASGVYGMNDEVWAHHELSLQEWNSSLLQATFLEKNGFKVQWGAAGFPTAYVATFVSGSGKPTIGFSVECDALPGLSQNKGVPYHDPQDYIDDAFSPTYGVGHGCGHNSLGTAAVYAAVATAKGLAANRTDGTVKVYGATAEEYLLGKAYAVSRGVYKGLDALVDWHPGGDTSTGWGSSNAMQSISFTFLGIAGHGGTPLGNKSALDAATITGMLTEFLREENLAPSGRIHYAIRNGGQAPNVTPEIAEVWYYVREGSPARVKILADKVVNCAKAAAMATQTKLVYKVTSGCWNKLPSQRGAELMYDNMQQIGATAFSAADQKFATTLQGNIGLGSGGYSTKVSDLQPPDPIFLGGGSTDVADISWQAPTIQMGTPIWPQGFKSHTWAVASSAASDGGHKALLSAAKYLAATAVDLYTQPNILGEMKEEFAKRTKNVKYEPLFPKNFEPPMYQPPDWFLKRTGQNWPPPNITWPRPKVISKEKFADLGPSLPPQDLPPLS